MTTDQKRQALIDAGRKIRSNASEETVEAAYAEYLDELAAEAEPLTTPGDDPGPPGEKGVDGIPAPPPAKEPVKVTVPFIAPTKTGETFQQAAARLADNYFGNRTPALVAWAKENLSQAEFDAIYQGKNLHIPDAALMARARKLKKSYNPVTREIV